MSKKQKTLEIAVATAGMMLPASAAMANTINSGGTGIEAPTPQVTHNKANNNFNAETEIQRLARIIGTNAIKSSRSLITTSHNDLSDNTYADESVTYAPDSNGRADMNKPIAIKIDVAKNGFKETSTPQLPIIKVGFEKDKDGKWSTSIQSTDPTTPNSFYRVSETDQQIVSTIQGSPHQSTGTALQETRNSDDATNLLEENLASTGRLLNVISEGHVPVPGDYMPQG